jgi:hypothetical protein
MSFLRSFIGAVAQEICLSRLPGGGPGRGCSRPARPRYGLRGARCGRARRPARAGARPSGDLEGLDRIDGRRMMGGMSKGRGVAERVAESIWDAVRATSDAARSLVGTERRGPDSQVCWDPYHACERLRPLLRDWRPEPRAA